MASDLDLETIRDRLMAFVESAGCCSVGVCNTDTLAGGPPSSDITRELASARSAIVFALPVDELKLELYMGKIDHAPYQQDYIQANNILQGIAGELTNQLRKFGYESSVVYAGNTPADGEPREVMPRNDSQREAAERYPLKPSDALVGVVPLISQRFLAAAAGVGFFGMSGNILTPTHGAAVSLGAVVTEADLPPTPPLPPEANYCDECNWCGSVCPTQFMSRTEFNTVQLGEHSHHKYSAREHPMRCAAHMSGLAGLSRDGKFSSWGPSRKPLPDEDDALLPTLLGRGADLARQPNVEGGFFDAHSGRKINVMCSACNLVCHPEREVRAKRLKMWRQGGVTVQHEDGRIEAMPVDEARAFLDQMPPERRAIYEDIEEEPG